jgi:hypothetical protein
VSVVGVLTDESAAGVYPLDEQYDLHVTQIGDDVYRVVLKLFGEEYPADGDSPIVTDGASVRAYLSTLADGPDGPLDLFCLTCDQLLWLECNVVHEIG